MLAIKTERGWKKWWIGESVPKDMDRVVEFQADGDELDLFIQAMHLSGQTVRGVRHTKEQGFHIAMKYERKK